MTHRLTMAVAVLLLSLTLAPSVAWSDADPASDILLGENVFFPYSPPVSNALQSQLNAEVAAAAKAHFPIKVALIASPVDLGAIPNLFGKPQEYAKFLDQEISFQATKQPLLVVMPGGYGVGGLPTSATAAAASLPKPASSQSDELARAAAGAVRKLAAAAGDPIGSAGGSTASSASSSTVPIVVGLVVVAVLAAAGVLALRRRSARPR
jgi:hypothetical protein